MQLEATGDFFVLSLYIGEASPRCKQAVSTLKRLCEGQLKGRTTLAIIDVEEEPERAVSDRVVALPTLIRWSPEPRRRVVGDMSSIEGVLSALDA